MHPMPEVTLHDVNRCLVVVTESTIRSINGQRSTQRERKFGHYDEYQPSILGLQPNHLVSE